MFLIDRTISADDVVTYARENGITITRGSCKNCAVGVLCSMFGVTEPDSIRDGARMFGHDIATNIEVGFEGEMFYWHDNAKMMPEWHDFGRYIAIRAGL